MRPVPQRRISRRAAVALGFSLALPNQVRAQAITPPPMAAPSTLPAQDEALLQGDYRGERLGDPIPAFLRHEQPPLLLLESLLDALRMRFTVAGDGTLAGRRQLDDSPFSFAPDGSYIIAGRAGRLAAADHLFRDGELYVTPQALALLAPVQLRIDLRDQRFTLVATGPLALDLARQRELARSRLDGLSQPDELPLQAFAYRGWGRPFGDVRANLQYSAGADAFRTVSYDALLSQELAFATGMLFVSGNDDTRLRDARLSLGRASPLGGVWGVRGLTSAFAGDVQTTSLPLMGSPGQMRGFTLSAYPLDRPDRFDQTLVEGDAPAGWDAELMRGDVLLDYQRVGVDGRYRFEDVPLLFGDNGLRVVLFGPDGQRREQARNFRIGSGMAPPGRLYWRVSAGEVGTRLLDAWLPDAWQRDDGSLSRHVATRSGGVTAGAEAELGLTRHLTATAFAARAPEDHRLDAPLRDTLGGGVRVSLPRVFLESVLAGQDDGGRAWSLGASGAAGRFSLSARHAQYEGFRSLDAVWAGEPLRSETRLQGSTTVPFAGRHVTLSSLVDRRRFEDGDHETAAQLQARFAFRGVSVGQALEWRRRDYFPDTAFAFDNGRLYYSPTLAGGVGPVRISAAARYDATEHRLDRLQLSGQWRISPVTSANFGATRGFADEDLDLGYGAWAGLWRDFGFFHANANIARNAAGEFSAGMGIRLSFGFDRAGRPALGSQPMAQQGAADVFVYNDLNGNSRFDAHSDAPLAGAGLLLNGQRGRTAHTNAQGRVFVTGLNITEPVTLEIDPGSTSDPFMVPALGGLRFMPRPGRSYDAQLALVESGEVSGMLLAARGGEQVGLSGVIVEILATRSRIVEEKGGPGLSVAALASRAHGAGAVLANQREERLPGAGDYRLLGSKRTQYDGSFLFDMVPPGRYLVRVRAGQEIRGTPLESASQPAIVTRGQLMVDDVELQLRLPVPGVASVLPARVTTSGARP